jgi:hypothetical protein
MELTFGDELIMQSCRQGVGVGGMWPVLEKFVGKNLKGGSKVKIHPSLEF